MRHRFKAEQSCQTDRAGKDGDNFKAEQSYQADRAGEDGHGFIPAQEHHGYHGPQGGQPVAGSLVGLLRVDGLHITTP